MKINSSIPSVGQPTDIGRNRATPSAATKSASAGGERVDISPLSAQLQEVGAGETAVSSARIAEIKQAIADGRFQINPEKIADGLLASVRDMLAHSKPVA